MARRRLSWRSRTVLGAVAIAVGLAAAASVTAAAAPGARRVPLRLAETGLYSDFASRTVDPRNLH